MERALLEGELVPLREKLLADEERLEMLLQQSSALEEKCQQERSHHQQAIEVCTGVNHWCCFYDNNRAFTELSDTVPCAL